MKILLDKGENPSHATDLNYVAIDSDIYIIDNHLAAIWCMAQLDLTTKYNFLHVDRHYDLSKYHKGIHSQVNDIDFTKISVEEISNYKCQTSQQSFQLITWDNYINLFCQKYPGVINYACFVTQKDGDFNYAESEYSELEIYELFDQIFEGEYKWIFNIDIDFFFTHFGEKTVQMYADEFIKEFARWVNQERKNIALIILCLSPECCGGWDKSKRVLDIIRSRL